MSELPVIVAMVGSAQQRSASRRLVAALEARCAASARVLQPDLATLPYFDDGFESGSPPAAVDRLRSAVSGACAVVVITPGHNGSMSAMAKNAIDWASRPFLSSPLSGKPCLIVAHSPSRTVCSELLADCERIAESADADVVGSIAFHCGSLGEAASPCTRRLPSGSSLADACEELMQAAAITGPKAVGHSPTTRIIERAG